MNDPAFNESPKEETVPAEGTAPKQECVWVLFSDEAGITSPTTVTRLYWWSDGYESRWEPSRLGARRFLTLDGATRERDEVCQGSVKIAKLTTRKREKTP